MIPEGKREKREEKGPVILDVHLQKSVKRLSCLIEIYTFQVTNLKENYKFSQSVSFVVFYQILEIKSYIPLRWSLCCCFQGCIVNLSVIPGYTAVTGWNRETTNIELVSSVGRAPARYSRGHRFKTRPCQFFFIQPKMIKHVIIRMAGRWWDWWYQHGISHTVRICHEKVIWP